MSTNANKEAMISSLSAMLKEDETLYAPVFGFLALDSSKMCKGYLGLTEEYLLFVALDEEGNNIPEAFTRTSLHDMQSVKVKKSFITKQYTIKIQFSKDTCKFLISENEKSFSFENQAENAALFAERLKALPSVN